MGTNGHPAIGANLSFTKFVFISPFQDDAAAQAKLRSAGSTISRGFFNDYDADGSRDSQPQETIQFLVANAPPIAREGIGVAKYALQLSSNYRPRLDEVVCDFTKRLTSVADLIVLNGAERGTRYTSAEMQNYAYKPALARSSGRMARNAVIIPMSKSAAWWEKTALERHAYF